MGKQHIIELNGKRYDALSGKIITKQPETVTPQAEQPKSGSIKHLEGIARRTHVPAKPPEPHRRPVEKSHTLMRRVVRKPITNKLHAVATVVGQAPPSPQPAAPAKTLSVKPLAKNRLIRKFSPATFSPNQGMVQPKIIRKPPLKPSLSAVAANASSVTVNPLNQAIANATSHQRLKLKRPKLRARAAQRLHVSPKTISIGAAALVVVLIGGFFGYKNIPSLKMRIASSRAGLHGTLPAYQPAGFHLDGISYTTGQINVSFRSNSDARNFTVTQTASSWNSDTLRDRLKTTEQASSPVEVPDKGKTLFIYNDSQNVTWVDAGVLYKIEGNSKLNSSQLLNLANSL